MMKKLKKSYHFNYHEFFNRLTHFVQDVQPRYKELQKLKHDLIDQKRRALRLHEFQTQVLTFFCEK